MQVYGAPDDSELRGVAAGFLDDTIKEMNSHLYDFNKKVLSNVTLVDSEREVTLTDDVYKEHLAYIHHTANDEDEAPLVLLPHAHFMTMYGDQTRFKTGIPVVYTFRSLHQDFKLQLGPAPSTSIADDYTLTVEYYRRIPLVTESSTLDVPQEVQTSLIYGAQKRMAIHIHADAAHPSVGALHELERDALSRLKQIDSHHPDTNKRFRLTDHTLKGRRAYNAGEIYIRIK